MKAKRKIWIVVKIINGSERLRAYNFYDDAWRLYKWDSVELVEVSETTFKRLIFQRCFPKRFGNSIRAYG